MDQGRLRGVLIDQGKGGAGDRKRGRHAELARDRAHQKRLARAQIPSRTSRSPARKMPAEARPETACGAAIGKRQRERF